MPFDISGSFSRVYDFEQDRNNGTKIMAARVDGEFDGIAVGLSETFLRDGRAPMSGNLRLGNNALTGLGDGSLANPAISFNSEANTGIYRPSAGKVAVDIQGTSRLEINTTGIAVTGNQTVSGNQTVNGTLTVVGAATVGSIALSGGATVWTSANDGPGSGLDADTLDGNQASAFALLASPALTGTPTAPTAAVGTNTTQIATTAFVNAEIANDVPGMLGAYAVKAGGNAFTGNQSIAGDVTVTGAGSVKVQLQSAAGPYNGEVRQGSDGFLYLSSGGPNVAIYVNNFANQVARFSGATASISGTLTIGTDNAYGVGWNGSLKVPTENAVYDQMELMAPLVSPALSGTPTAPTAAAATSTTQIATTAFVQQELARAALRTVPIMAGAMTARTTNGPSSGNTELATNKIMIVSKDFDQTTSEFVQFDIPMPKSWDGGNIQFEVDWTAAAGAVGQLVAWELQCRAVRDDDALDQAFGAVTTVTDTLLALNDEHKSATSGNITIAGTIASQCILKFQLSRNPAHASDNLAADAKLLGCRIKYTTNARDDT